MQQSWRWFGPKDTVSIDDMLQAGVETVVSALHHIPCGELWPVSEIKLRQQQIACKKDGSASGLDWSIVESLPVSEAIKQQTGDWLLHLENYRLSLHNLAAQGIKVICYNFMPVLDWTRTDLDWRMQSGASCMRFDYIDFALFDIFILQRAQATDDFPKEIVIQAQQRYQALNPEQRQQLADNIVCGLPGATDNYSMQDVREHLTQYAGMSADQLRQHFIDFLEAVIPTAQSLGMRMCCHPDDPPFELLGLPRVMSTESDYLQMLSAVPSSANGMALCAGSLGARGDNDLTGMMQRLGPHVHFLHLRNVLRESQDIKGSFYETEHLAGDNDMVALIGAVLKEEQRRSENGEEVCSIPFRPDHGLHILDDLKRQSQPGYPAIGRLKGLAELRGIIAAMSHAQVTLNH